MEGTVEKLSEEESDAYYHSRPRGSQIGAHVSPQSSVLPNGRGELEARNAEFKQVGPCSAKSVLIQSLFGRATTCRARMSDAYWGGIRQPWCNSTLCTSCSGALWSHGKMCCCCCCCWMVQTSVMCTGAMGTCTEHSWCMPAQKFADESKEIPRPDNWGGYLIRPKAIEFWHGRPSRLHDRICFRKENGAWKQERLAP